MKKRVVVTAAALLSSMTMIASQATDYAFPTGMTVTIERDAVPIYKEDSSVVYPVVNYFTVKMPNGDQAFALRNEEGEDLPVIKQGDRYFVNAHVPVGENVYFGPDSQNVADPVRVMVQGPINLGHVHFDFASYALKAEAKEALMLMAKEMADNNLTSAYLVGMTDRIGSEDANLLLAEKRANAAKNYLKRKLAGLGITNAVITTEAMGEYLSQGSDGSVNPFDRKVAVTIYPTI